MFFDLTPDGDAGLLGKVSAVYLYVNPKSGLHLAIGLGHLLTCH